MISKTALKTFLAVVTKVFLWQRNFIICCFLIIYSIPVCVVGSSILFIVRIIPSVLHQWEVSAQRESFILAWVLCTTVTTVVGFVVGFVIAVIMMPVYLPPKRYLTEGYLSGLYGPFAILSMVDESANYFMDEYPENGGGWKVLPFLKNNISGRWSLSRNVDLDRTPSRNVRSVHAENTSSRHGRNVNPGDTLSRSTNLGDGHDMPRSSNISDQFWNRFISQCIKSTSELIEAKWITTDDIKSMDSAMITSIPAIAVLAIIFDSTTENRLQKEDIECIIDDNVCKKEDRSTENEILRLLWVLVDDTKNTLLSSDELLADSPNMRVIMAMLCGNGADRTEELKEFLNANEIARSATENILLTTKVTNFAFEVTRFEPFINRMSKIYTCEYAADIEKGHCGVSEISDTAKDYDSSECENQIGQNKEDTS